MFEELDNDLNFESEDELRKPIPEGTVTTVQVRKDRDGQVAEFKTGKSKFGPWMIVPFEVVEGEHRGDWASMMLNVKTDDRRFRKTLEVVLGIDLTNGAPNISLEAFRDALIGNLFEAEVGPAKKKNENGVYEETGYNNVVRLNSITGPREVSVSDSSDSVPPSVGEPDDVDQNDDEIPF